VLRHGGGGGGGGGDKRDGSVVRSQSSSSLSKTVSTAASAKGSLVDEAVVFYLLRMDGTSLLLAILLSFQPYRNIIDNITSIEEKLSNTKVVLLYDYM